MSASPGWYSDPGGGQGLFRYWDGRRGQQAVSPNPSAPPPAQLLRRMPLQGDQPNVQGGQPYGQGGQPAYGQSPYGQDYGSSTSANYPGATEEEVAYRLVDRWCRALVIAIAIVAVIAVRAVTGATGSPVWGNRRRMSAPAEHCKPRAKPPGRRKGPRRSGLLPMLGPPWGAPQGDTRGAVR